MENEMKKYTQPDRSKFGSLIDINKLHKKYKPRPKDDDKYAELGHRDESKNPVVFHGGDIQEFSVGFYQMKDSSSQIVRFSKPNVKKVFEYTISSIQLQNITDIKYKGFDIRNSSLMYGYVKEMARKITNIPIAESIGFTPQKDMFYNFDYIISDEMPEILHKHWSELLQNNTVKQILLMSIMGIGASLFELSATPIINIWGKKIDVDFIKALILSPFGNPNRGFRDVFCLSKEHNKLSIDNEIIPVIIDLISYNKYNADFDLSGDGYYFDRIGQFFSPLFIISEKPVFNNVHLHIEIQDDFIERENIISIKREMFYYYGQLSMYIANCVIKSKDRLDDMFNDNFWDFVENNPDIPNVEKISTLENLAYVTQSVLNELFGIIEDEWIFNWQKTITDTDEIALQFYNKLKNIDNKQIAINRKDYQNEYETIMDNGTIVGNNIDKIGFYEMESGKKYIYIQEGKFRDEFSVFDTETRERLFEYWHSKNKDIAYAKGNIRDKPYRKRETFEKTRPWFYRFCLTALESLHPKKEGK